MPVQLPMVWHFCCSKAEVYATSVDLPATAVDPGQCRRCEQQWAGSGGRFERSHPGAGQPAGGVGIAIAVQSQTLLTNDGYQFLDQESTGVVAGDSSALSAGIVDRYNALFALGPLAQASTTMSTTTPIFAAIREQYPNLFRIGDLAALSDLVAGDNPLAVLSTERAKELLQLQGSESLPAYTAAAEPLTQAIDQLESDIQALQARQEAESSRRQQLAQRRDLAWSTLTTLKNKNAELNLSVVTVNSEVRLAAPAVAPIHPVAGGADHHDGPGRDRGIDAGGLCGLLRQLHGCGAVVDEAGARIAELTKPGAATATAIVFAC